MLFFCPAFRDYDVAIKNKLIDLGAEVIHYGNHPYGWFYNFIMSSNQLRNRLRKVLDKKRENYFRKISAEIENKFFDFVFVIKGDTLPKWFLSDLKSKNQSARIVLYQWDSLKAYYYRAKSDFTKQFDLYNAIFSFDPVDCDTIPGLIYRPLFYLDIYKQLGEKKKNEQRKLDLFFVGAGSPDRFYVLNQIVKDYPDFKYSFYLNIVLFSKYIKYIFRPIDGFTFYLSNLSQKKIMDELVHCKAVIDVPSSYQDGLTIRTFETLAAQRKLITTNKNILKEPFFNPENIAVIDKDNLEIPTDFLRKPFEPVDFEKYSLDIFLLEMLIEKKI